MELELAKVSLERDSMSQQLLRVIRQKMALSQELEAWQVSKKKHQNIYMKFNPEHFKLHQLPFQFICWKPKEAAKRAQGTS